MFVTRTYCLYIVLGLSERRSLHRSSRYHEDRGIIYISGRWIVAYKSCLQIYRFSTVHGGNYCGKDTELQSGWSTW